MKAFALMMTLAALAACGKETTKEVQVPVVTQAPYTVEPQPDYLPQPQISEAPEIPVTDQTSTTSINTTTTTGTSATVDPFGVAYNPMAEIPYSAEYMYQMTSQYNPAVPAYYNELNNYMNIVTQPITMYEPTYQLMYVYDRYCQERAFLNYNPSFGKVVVGQNGWDRNRYNNVRNQMSRSQRWVNADIYQIISQNLKMLQQRNYRSAHGYENKIRDAIRNRNHRLAAQLNDELLREIGSARGRSDNNRNDDNNRRKDDNNDRRNDNNDRHKGNNNDRGGRGSRR